MYSSPFQISKSLTRAQLAEVALGKVRLQLEVHEAVDRRGDGGAVRGRHRCSEFWRVLNPVLSVPPDFPELSLGR